MYKRIPIYYQKKGGIRLKKSAAKQNPHTQRTDCKLVASIKRNFFPITAKLILFQTKTEVVITNTAQLLFSGSRVSLKVLDW